VVRGLPPVVGIAAGAAHTAAITASGDVWTWGDNSCGQLGPLPLPVVLGVDIDGAGVNGAGPGVDGDGVNGAGVNWVGAGINGAGVGVNGAGAGVNLDQFYRTHPAKVASFGRASQH
jgi:hypothetical protein